MNTIDDRIPATILTGALGSGKTTLLNYILNENHGLKIAVIVNEFGEVSIDHHLVAATEEQVVELSNGCICCTVRDDLANAVSGVLQRADRPEYILVETTGLADPRPVAQTFLMDELSEQVRLDAIITVVDGDRFFENLELSGTTTDQILAGDIMILNKTDLITPEKLQQVKDVLADLNTAARILETHNAKVDLRLLLDVGMFQLKRMLQQTEQSGQQDDQLIVLDNHYDGHLHEDDISSVSFVSQRPFDYEKFGYLMQNLPTGIFRGKGILWIDGYEEKLVFHLVGDRSQAVAVGEWGTKRENKLVLIGKSLDREEIIKMLEACLAG